MDLKIEGRTALVFGAGGGWAAIGRQLLDEGANVVFADIDQEALQRVCAGLDDAGRRALPLQWDLGDLGIIGERLQAIAARFGTVDILVNNTGARRPRRSRARRPELVGAEIPRKWCCRSSRSPTACCPAWSARAGADHHLGLLGRHCADPQSRPVQRPAHDAGRLVQDAGPRSGPPWRHRQHRGPRAHRHPPSPTWTNRKPLAKSAGSRT